MNIRPSDSSIFNTEWLNYMDSINLPVSRTMLFYRIPIANDLPSLGAHIDINRDSLTECVPWAINWVIEGDNSKMTWYKLPNDDKAGYQIKRTMSNTPFVEWSVNDLIKIDQHEIKNCLTLVKTDVPHSITMGTGPRWCISVRSTLNDSTMSYTWEELIDHLRSLNLLIERN